MRRLSRCTVTKATNARNGLTSSFAGSTSVQAANDVGWERMPDGTCRAWISEYDGRHRFNPETQNRIKQEYAYHAVSRQQRALGRTVQRRELENGEIEVVIGGYR